MNFPNQNILLPGWLPSYTRRQAGLEALTRRAAAQYIHLIVFADFTGNLVFRIRNSPMGCGHLPGLPATPAWDVLPRACPSSSFAPQTF